MIEASLYPAFLALFILRMILSNGWEFDWVCLLPLQLIGRNLWLSRCSKPED